MAKNQSTYTLKIDAELGNLQKTLNEAKASLASFMASGNAPKGLEKAFEKINDLLGKISDKTGKPLDIKGLTSTGKDLENVQDSFRAIVRLLGDFNDLSDDVKFSFLSADEQKKITAIVDALKKYSGALDEITKKNKALEGAQKTLAKDENALGKAKKKVTGLENDRTKISAKLSGVEGKLKAEKSLENANPKDIAKYEAEIVKLKADLTILDSKLEEANEELGKSQTAYNASAKSVSELEKEIKRTSGDALKALKKEAQDLGVSLDGLNGHDTAAQVKILTDRLNELKQKGLNGAEEAFNNIVQGSEKAEEAVKGLGEEVKEATKATEQMNEVAAQREAFENKIKQFLGLQGAAQLMRAALRDALSTITELDATMTEMAVVTDLTVGDYWDQLPEYSQRASELGVSINSAYKAATLYYQQGLKTNEVVALSNETLKMAKIAGIDAAEATDKITAALRGFNMELNEASAQKIADVYSELAAITAADVDEISTAMTKTASIASSAGMEFETTAAFLSQIIETTRESAETAGTAMKTVIARFQELKKSPSEIGEVEGEIVDANAIEGALRQVGVSLRDSAGQFRELDDVFLELSSKWDGLDKNTQRYIATIAAGSRQQSRFIAMMQDYSRTQELVTAANNSAGASQKQFEKTMESLEAKVEKLKNAWHEFTMGIMNSDLVKTGVDILTKFLEIINKATSAFGGLGGSLMKITTMLGIFKLGSKIFDKFRQPVIDLFADIVKRAGIAGSDSAKAYKDNLEKEKNNFSNTNEQQEKPADTKSFWQRFGNSTIGLDKWSSGNQHGKKKREAQNLLTKYDRKALEAKTKTGTDSEIAAAKMELEAYDELQREAVKEWKAQWKDYGEAVSQVGSNMTSLGVGVSMFGGLLASLGLEEVGETITGIGTAITFIGTALSVIPPILTVITSHPIIATITVVLAVILGIILAINKALQDGSPEGKLKAAEEAADRAADAAERAKEEYEGIASAMDELEDSYKTLDELTRRTEEWYKQLRKVNSAVLDLVTQYPELARFVKNEDGVLTIDLASKEVQDVLTKYETASLTAANASALANLNVAENQAEVDYSKLGQTALVSEAFTKGDIMSQQYGKNWGVFGNILGYMAAALTPTTPGWVEELKTEKGWTQKARTDSVAKAYAQGILSNRDSEEYNKFAEGFEGGAEALGKFLDGLGDNEKAFREYGDTLIELEDQNKALFDSIASSAQSLADTSGWSPEQTETASNIASGELTKEFYDKRIKDLEQYTDTKGINDSEEVRKAIEAQYGTGATIDDSGKVTKDGTEVTTLTVDEIKAVVANQYATTETTKAFEAAKTVAGTLAEELGTDLSSDLFSDKNGGELSSDQVEELESLTDIQYQQMFDALSITEKEAFNNDLTNFKNYFATAIKGAKESFTSAEKIIGKGKSFIGANATQAHALAKIAGQNDPNNFVEAYNEAYKKLKEDQKEVFAQQIASMSTDPTNREGWDKVVSALEDYGISPTEEFTKLIGIATKNARYSDTHLKNMGVSESLISQYNATTDEEVEKFHATFEKWKKDYDIANDETAKTEHELIQKVIDAMVEGYEKQIDAQEEAYNAIAETNDKLVSQLSEKIQEDRQKRENDKTEADIADSRNRLAYLAMDTSGGNALDRLQLQSEIDQAEQDYQDSLIDQALQKLEDANAKAAEQRERQIELARQQLELYQNSEQIIAEATNTINNSIEQMASGMSIEDTELGKLLAPNSFLSKYEGGTFWTELSSALSELVPTVEIEINITPETPIVLEKGPKTLLGVKNTSSSTISGGGVGGKFGAHYIKGLATGGLVDFTGPAWLDGTPSKPEYVLNAAQTEHFFSLVDVLEGIDTKDSGKKSAGDNYFDININVDKLENDYDVEKVADKIRRMIYDDATYRNVNSINHIR